MALSQPLASPKPPVTKNETALVLVVRDKMAASFSTTVSAAAAGVVELLEAQVAETQDREKGRPLREAIELLRTVLPGFEGRLRRQVAERFAAALCPAGGEPATAAMHAPAALCLVADDDMQEQIVTGNATRRLRDVLAEEFFQLSGRLAAVVGEGPLPENRNPANPRLFACALLDALAAPGVSAQGRFTAFSACSPALLGALRAAYRVGNELLVRQGVLPELKRGLGAPQPLGSSPVATGQTPAGAHRNALPDEPRAKTPGACRSGGTSVLAWARVRLAAIASRHGDVRAELEEVAALLHEEEMRSARSGATS
jgi:Protein of unknown function (DUF1631)